MRGKTQDWKPDPEMTPLFKENVWSWSHCMAFWAKIFTIISNCLKLPHGLVWVLRGTQQSLVIWWQRPTFLRKHPMLAAGQHNQELSLWNQSKRLIFFYQSSSRLNGDPPKDHIHILIPWAHEYYLIWKKGLQRGNWGMDFVMSQSSWIFQVSPNSNSMCPYKNKAVRFDRQKRWGDYDHRGRN